MKLRLTQQKNQIDTLKNQIDVQKKEINEKDKQIGDKEKEIYTLKKKTQELEKFKFVLDYKIRDLKKDIAPREQQISELKLSTENMDESLRECNDINTALGYTVDNLRNQQEEMTEVIKSFRNRIRKNDLDIQSFKNKVYSVVQYIDDHDQLKRAVHRELYPLVLGSQIKNVEIDPDIKKEYVNQKKYLESSHHSLQKRLEKEDQIHRQDNLNVMNENTQLIDEINNLRREVREQRESISKKNNEKMANAAKSKVLQASAGGSNNAAMQASAGLNNAADGGHESLPQSNAEEMEDMEKKDQEKEIEYLINEANTKRIYIDGIQVDLQRKIDQAQKLAEELNQAINGDQN